MEFSVEDSKIITEALIKASNSTETEWLNLEKIILDSYSSINSEITRSNVLEMWNQLYQKVDQLVFCTL
jgi:hypothetical protein